MKIISFGKASDRESFSDNTSKLIYESSFDKLEDWALIEKGSRNIWAIYLHGHGSTGEQLYTRPDVVENYLAAIRKNGLGIIAPNLRNSAWMSHAAVYDFHEILAFVKEKYPGASFIFLSASMGGTGALIYSTRHPEDISGIAAGCPASDLTRYCEWCRTNNVHIGIADAIEESYQGKPADRPDIYREHSAYANYKKLTMPLHLSHGNADSIIPVEESRLLAAKLSGKKDFCYLEIEGGHHDAPLLHAGERLHWLLEHL